MARPTSLETLTCTATELTSNVVDATKNRIKGMICVTSSNGTLQVSWDNSTWYPASGVTTASSSGTWANVDPADWYEDCYIRFYRGDGFANNGEYIMVLESM